MNIDPSEKRRVALKFKRAIDEGWQIIPPVLKADIERLNNMRLMTKDLLETIEQGLINDNPQLYPDGNLEWTFGDHGDLMVSAVLNEKRREIIITSFFMGPDSKL